MTDLAIAQCIASKISLLSERLTAEAEILAALADVRQEASERGWNAFHRAWSSAVGTPGYDKEVWIAAERAYLADVFVPLCPACEALRMKGK